MWVKMIQHPLVIKRFLLTEFWVKVHNEAPPQCQLCYWISNWNKTKQNWKQKECVLKVNIKLEKCKWKQKKFRF